MYTPVDPVLLYKSGVSGGQNYIGVFSWCTVKYRSGSILVFFQKRLAKLWPFFDLVFFVFGAKYKVNILFALNNFWRDAVITFEVCRIVYRYSKEVKFDFGNHPINFGRIIVLFY